MGNYLGGVALMLRALIPRVKGLRPWKGSPHLRLMMTTNAPLGGGGGGGGGDKWQANKLNDKLQPLKKHLLET